VAGQLNSNVVFIIQARMKSTRLPGKILMPLPLGSNHPLLLWIVNALKCSKYHNNNIFIATSINKENDLLVEFCNQYDIHIFRGDEDNVLSRFTRIIKENNCKTVVRLTADNPIIDIEILDNTIDFHIQNNHDYTKTEGLPIGMNFEIISNSSLLNTEISSINNQDKEHVTSFVRNSPQFNNGTFFPTVSSNLKDLRLTIDYATDFTLLSVLLTQKILNPTLNIGFEFIEKNYQNYPWLFDSNGNNFQKKQFNNLNAELLESINILKSCELLNSAEILEKLVEL
jgi:spore coat polysaccharide biosynthesis protein SpsF